MEFKPILEFTNNSPDFAFGFECGRIYQEMKYQMFEIEGYYHKQNLDQFKLMCNTFGYKIQQITSINSEEYPNDYIFLQFIRLPETNNLLHEQL